VLFDLLPVGFKESTVHLAFEILILRPIQPCVSSPSEVLYSERSLWLPISEIISDFLCSLYHGSIGLSKQKSTILNLLLNVIIRNGP
jgi:hypothetical protein